MGKTVVILSGGLDSTVLLARLIHGGEHVHAVTVDYGQRHGRREIAAAQAIADHYHVPHRMMGALGMTMMPSALTRPEVTVPEGHYADESMKITVVPNRNMVLLALSGAYAVSIGAERLVYGAHTGDHAIYPDCRPEFVGAMQAAFWLCDWKRVELAAPFINMTKADIVREGAMLEVPFAKTWSCYKGGDRHCGKCGTCVERREAFDIAVVADPTEYEVGDVHAG